MLGALKLTEQLGPQGSDQNYSGRGRQGKNLDVGFVLIIG